jgi:sialic acid synthase SpsE
MIEKHFTLDKTSPGPDHGFAIEPKGLEALVEAVREAEEKRADGEEFDIDPVVLGTSRKDTHEKEKVLRDYAYRSIYADTDIEKGETFTEENMAVYRAGELPKGMHPRHLGSMIGQSAPHEIEQGTPLTLETLLGGSEAE